MKVATNASERTQHTSSVTGARLVVALATSVGLSLAAGFATAYGLPLLSASWGETDRLAAVITLEVYVAIIVGHVIAFGGVRRLFHSVCLRSMTVREFAGGLAMWGTSIVAAAVLYLALAPLVWPLTAIRDALLWVGADGGRLADADPLLFTLVAGRAAGVAPFAEELLFRGALFGWMRRWLPAYVAIFLTAALFALAHPLPVLWPAAFSFGAGAAWFRERSGAVTPFVVIHVLNNMMLIGISYVATGWRVPDLFGPSS
jgi:membrane protease YdiL (CAAX protease family)